MGRACRTHRGEDECIHVCGEKSRIDTTMKI
jgi:hypothetical protein